MLVRRPLPDSANHSSRLLSLREGRIMCARLPSVVSCLFDARSTLSPRRPVQSLTNEFDSSVPGCAPCDGASRFAVLALTENDDIGTQQVDLVRAMIKTPRVPCRQLWHKARFSSSSNIAHRERHMASDWQTACRALSGLFSRQ